MQTFLLCLFGYITVFVLLPGTQAQDCTTNGRQVGVEPIDRAEDDIDANDVDRVYIMKSEGGISCYGVLTRWSFYKSTACEMMKFQVYRPDDPSAPNQYTMVGQNVYDPTTENCNNNEGMVDLYVPYLEQIPVEPGDMIGWVQDTAGPGEPYMIKYDNTGAEVVQIDGCISDPGDTCPPTNTVTRAYSLRAHLYQGPAPIISNLPQTVDVAEDTAVSELVFTVYAQHISNAIDTTIVQEHSVPLTFSIDTTDFAITDVLPGTGTDQVYEGRITVSQALDYERQSLYTIQVTVEGLGLKTIETLTININRANEPHVVINLPSSTSISAATTKAGQEIFQVELDGTTNNPFPMVYYIEEIIPYNPPQNPHPPFIINSTTGAVSVTMDLVDWWEVTVYDLHISVTDGVHKDGPQTLRVTILDPRAAPVIDNIDSGVTAVTVKEDAVGGSSVFKVEVTSPSDPSTYEFSLQDYNYHFHIDSKTGEIWLSDPNTLDFAVNIHDLTVQMKDDFQDAVAKVLRINVGWVNQAPEFVPTEYWISIPEGCDRVPGCEGSPPSTPSVLPWSLPGLEIIAQDRDADNGYMGDAINCEILPGFAYDLFAFQDPTSCKTIQQLENIDVDGSPQYMSIELAISVEDNSGLKNSGKVYISVYDINDNAPVFNPGSYGAEIDENTPGGVSLVTAFATDRDSGINAEFTYSLGAYNDPANPNNPDGTYYFEVDPWTGVVSTKHPVDYEALDPNFKRIIFNIWATDKGEYPGPLSRPAQMTVIINDVNDNAPEFVCSESEEDRPGLDEPLDERYPCFYNMEVKSNSLKGTYVWQLYATDEDVITPSPKFYKLVPESDFHLSYDIGNITVNTESLKTNHKYVIYALATDEGTPELISTPSVVRIESYSMKDYAVDVTVQITDSTPALPCGSFDQDDFLRATRNYITNQTGREWFVKDEGRQVGCENDRAVIIIYALRDISTYLYENLEEQKHFVPTRYEFLKPLRKTILGIPHDDYKEYMADNGFDVILVMPWHQIWLIDTLPGLILLLILMIAFVAFWIGLGVWCCKKNGVCCFKKKPPVEHVPVKPPPPSVQRRRRPSTDTVHSLIVEKAEDLWPN